MKDLMQCGHTANAHQDGKPVCVICIGIDAGATVIVEKPDLTGRKARCSYYGSKCQNERGSDYNLAFFEHRPNQEHDGYYCGCWGWD